MPSSPPIFSDVQDILFTIADARDPDARDQIYGRHDAKGRFNWDDEASFLASIANPHGAGDTPLIPPLDYASMPASEVRAKCTLLKMLITQPGATTPAMPRLRAGTSRRYATDDEIGVIVGWLQALVYPRS